VDNIDVRISNIPHAGRGAFAKRPMYQGQVVTPVPLQCFQNRNLFQKTVPEQLYVNYCIQPEHSDMIFYPYGPGVNLINHSSRRYNVALQWSNHPQHHSSWLDLSYDDFWKVTTPGGLILEVVALRDIAPGEEYLLDYGQAWEDAWQAHVAQWKPPLDADSYVYPEDLDETEVLRTVQEQKTNPYPKNLITICNTPDWDRKRGNHVTWKENSYAFGESMALCHILTREKAPNNDYIYTVSLQFHEDRKRKAPLEYDETVPFEDQYIDFKVPRKAIRWIEKPYYDDEHLDQAFRHPIGFPGHLVPRAWKKP
jgi:hypothetical protein